MDCSSAFSIRGKYLSDSNSLANFVLTLMNAVSSFTSYNFESWKKVLKMLRVIIKEILERSGFRFSKSLGQNFLIDRNALLGIVDAGLKEIVDLNGAKVLEVGPGLGVLTEEMLSRGVSVTAVEKDPVLAARLKESLGSPEKLDVVAGDALRYISEGGSEIQYDATGNARVASIRDDERDLVLCIYNNIRNSICI